MNKEIKEIHGVPNEASDSHFGLTKTELRNRLKHIAGLCYALSCDISNVEIEAEQLRGENAELHAELERIKGKGVQRKFKRSPEDIEKRRKATQKYWARKRAEREAMRTETAGG